MATTRRHSIFYYAARHTRARSSTNFIDSTDPRRMWSFLESIGAVTRPPPRPGMRERERERRSRNETDNDGRKEVTSSVVRTLKPSAFSIPSKLLICSYSYCSEYLIRTYNHANFTAIFTTQTTKMK